MAPPLRGWGVNRAAERLRTEVKRTDAGCIEWLGGKMTRGYGMVWHEGRQWYAHRLAWTLANGPIPDGLLIMHSCDNRACVNVEHMALGTVADNAADMVAKGRGRGRFSAPIK